MNRHLHALGDGFFWAGRRLCAGGLWLGAAGLLFLAAGPWAAQPARADGPPAAGLRRWAILSARLPNPQLGDLVTAEMSKIPGIELVERDQLKAITDEQTLEALKTSGSAGRLKIGHLLKADALVLLSMETAAPAPRGEKDARGSDDRTSPTGPGAAREGAEDALAKAPDKLLRVTICDCRQGARLRVDVLPANGDAMELAAAVARCVAETKASFAGGIKWLAAVPRFLSRDLSHAHDNLELVYCELVQNVLREILGAAVIEIEEARAIRTELETAGADLAQRVVPLVIEGEFQTLPDGKRMTMSLTVRLMDGRRVIKEVSRGGMAESEVPAWLTGPLRDEILRAGKIEGAQGLSVDQQFASLVRRADAFALIGRWRDAINLREAAILLKPSLPEQRIKIVKEIRSRSEQPRLFWKTPEERLDPRKNEAVLKDQIERALNWRAAMEHVEFLIRNGQVDLRTALPMLSESYGRFTLYKGIPLPFDPAAAYRDMLPGVIAAADRLATKGPDDRSRLWQLLGDFAWHDVSYGSEEQDFAKAFARVLEVLDRTVPADMYLDCPYYLGMRRPTDNGDEASSSREYAKAYEEYLQKMRQSSRPFNVLRGRAGAAIWAIRHSPAPTGAQLEELKQVHDEWARILQSADIRDHYLARDQLARTVKEVAKILHPTAPITMPAEPDPPTIAKGPAKGITLRRLQLMVRRKEGQTIPLSQVRYPCNSKSTVRTIFFIPQSAWWVNCGKGLEAHLQRGAILFMRTPPVLEEVVVDPDADFDDLKWDGKYIWISSRQKGLYVTEPSGKLAAHFTPERGMPPADRRMLLAVLGEGEVVAAGATGDPPRLWCTRHVISGEKKETHILLEASHAPPGLTPAGQTPPPPDILTGGVPSFLHVYQPPGENQDRLLFLGTAPGRYLRVINLRTNQVSFYSTDERVRFPGGGYDRGYWNRDGQMMAAGDRCVDVCRWRSDLHRFRVYQEYRYGERITGGESACLVPTGKWLYFFSSEYWFRLDLQTFAQEKLHDDLAPQMIARAWQAASDTYGILLCASWASNRTDYFQLVLPDMKDSPPPPGALEEQLFGGRQPKERRPGEVKETVIPIR